MNIYISTFNYEEELFKTASDLRHKIFVDEFKNDKFLEFDTFDLEAIHYVLFFNNLPVGVARAAIVDDKYTIDRFGILKQYRSKGFGTLLLRFITTDLIHANKDIIVLTDDMFAIFYERNNFINTGKKENNFVKLIFSKNK